jgi:hypothetical protein
MASPEQKGARFPGLVGVGVAMGVVVIVVAFVIDTEIGIPLLILAAICLLALAAFRMIATSNAGSESDATDNVPKQEPRGERPLGDTPEAHDEINAHDLPLDHPGRHETEKVSQGADGTTRGPLQ